MNKSSFYKLFLLNTLISPFLGYFFNSGLIAYGPLIVMMFVVVLSEVLKPSVMKYKDWLSVFYFIPYTICAAYFYLINPYESNILTTYFLTIFLIPLFVFVFLKLSRYNREAQFNDLIYKYISFFLIGQLIVCLGQIMTYTFGFGLPVSAEYGSLYVITGTYNNPNDLATIILLVAFCISKIENTIKNNKKNIIWFIIFLLLLITGSRSALFVTLIIFMLTRKINVMSVLATIMISVVGIFFVDFIIASNNSGDIISRMALRLGSFIDIYEKGLSSDNSINIRMESYLHFLNNLHNLGLGSGEINNYYKYATNATFQGWLLFQNPHSLIVELGYWLGWIGLLGFFIPFGLLVYQYQRSFLFFFVALISMSISSSVLGSFIYFLFLILCIFSSYKVEIKK